MPDYTEVERSFRAEPADPGPNLLAFGTQLPPIAHAASAAPSSTVALSWYPFFCRHACVAAGACAGCGGAQGNEREVTGQVTGEVTGEVARLLAVLSGDMSRQELQQALGLKHEDHFRAAYLTPALNLGLVEMTLPDVPRSSKQRYRLTATGQRARGRT